MITERDKQLQCGFRRKSIIGARMSLEKVEDMPVNYSAAFGNGRILKEHMYMEFGR